MKNLNINIGAFIKRRGTAFLLAGTLSVACLTGCVDEVNCEIPTTHAHMFVNEDGYIRYVISERKSFEGYNRSYNSVELNEEEVTLYGFLDTKDLIRIDDNIDLVLAQQEMNKPFTAYEYSETVLTSVGRVISSTTKYNWTNNPQHGNLTGKELQVHYIYQAYNVKKGEDGKYVLVPSPLVEDITEVMEDYPYIRTNYYILVDEYNVDVKIEDMIDLKELEEAKSSRASGNVLKKSID